jgi:hypothetical protein
VTGGVGGGYIYAGPAKAFEPDHQKKAGSGWDVAFGVNKWRADHERKWYPYEVKEVANEYATVNE